MSTTAASRREVVTSLAISVGALTAVIAPTTALADQHETMPVQGDLPHVRRRIAERRHRRLRGQERLSRQGLHNSLAALQDEDGAITDDDKDFFDRVIDTIFDNIDEAYNWLVSSYTDVESTLSDVGKGMYEYMKGAFEWVQTLDMHIEQIRRSMLSSMDFIIAAAVVGNFFGWAGAALVLVIGVGALVLSEWDVDQSVRADDEG